MKSNLRFKKNKRGIECLNCHQPISSNDNFCSNCGQVNDLKPLSIKQYLTEFLAGFFSFDTRTLNTIFPLLFKPGKVTNEYIHGERMKYVNPFQLYLHVSILFFLFVSLSNSIFETREILATKNIALVSPIKGDSIKLKSSKDTNKLNITQKKQLLSNKRVEQLITKDIDSLFFNKQSIEDLNDSLVKKNIKDIIVATKFNESIKKLSKQIVLIDTTSNYQNTKRLKREYFNQLKIKLNQRGVKYKLDKELLLLSKERQKVVDAIVKLFLGKSYTKKIKDFGHCKSENIAKSIDSLGYPVTRENIYLFKKSKELYGKNLQDSLVKKATSKISIVLFFMLPIFAFVLKIFYFRKKLTFTEHLIFVFHVQTVFFLTFLFSLILDLIFNTNTGYLLFILFFVYLFIAFLKFYNQKGFKTFLKFVLVNITFSILSIVGVLIILILALII